MASLKERLQARADVSQKVVVLTTGCGEEAVIRRLSVAERNQLVERFKLGTSDPTAGKDEQGVTYGIAMVAASLVPPMTEAEVGELPSAVADELAGLIMDFNAWTERSRKELADQFRAPAGPSV